MKVLIVNQNTVRSGSTQFKKVVNQTVKSTVVNVPFRPVPKDYPNQRLKQYFKSLGINWNTHIDK